MPSIVDYSTVVEHMMALGLQSLYFNSGAFGFAPGVATLFVGWIGPDDPSIRPEALAAARRVAFPYSETLAWMAGRAWQMLLPGPAWIMPRSNWAYELDFGGKAWLPQALERIGIDPTLLRGHTDSPAIQFEPEEPKSFDDFTCTLLQELAGSDFAIAWPRHRVTCTIHHHEQLWWVSSEPRIMEGLNRVFDQSTS